ncbi:hypothetical protein CCZ37_07295 [Vibrio qinghaiensis]|jgi:chromosome segregation ATPase|uniref:Uncharacterized protein n=1 Tax=Vibrio qinghaiensis TaxID=2025808 RepID=A0A223MXV6_9VIBR|nr:MULTISPECIES: hypothetical protein [Vibrio]ASU22406.1 hypothetical protein CCZ37_07295 [Vibrio qinghaiensis]
MKKHSKRWKEFGQIIEIIDIRINKQQRILVKLRKLSQELEEHIDEYWQRIEVLQQELKSLAVVKETNALSRLFMRRESIKTSIESVFFDASVTRQKAEDLASEIEQVEAEKRRLEKRKDALHEIREELRYEKEC